MGSRMGRAATPLWRAGLTAALLCGIGLLPWLSHTDPALTVLKARSADRDPDPAALAAVRAQLGLEESPLMLLWRWLGGLWRGDAGRSWISGAEVTPAVTQALGASLLLMAVSLVVACGTAAAVCARTLHLGARRRLHGRTPGGSIPAVLAALPEFLTASVLATVVGVHLGWLPALGWYGPQWTVLPALALGLPAGAVLGRLLDDQLPAAFAEPWATAAASRGLPGRKVARHALHRCLPGLLPNLGLFAVGLTGGAVAVEQIFDIPGLGRTILQAALAQDLPVLQAGTLALVALAAVTTAAARLAVGRLAGPALRDGALHTLHRPSQAVPRRRRTVDRASPAVHRPPQTVDRTSPAVHRAPRAVDRPPHPVHRPPHTRGRSPYALLRRSHTVHGPPSTARRILPIAYGSALAYGPAGAYGLLLAVVIALGLPRDPLAVETAHRLQAPTSTHPFGTDALGRDLLARVAHGALDTLLLAVVVSAAALVAGVLLGLLPRLSGPLVDTVNAVPPVAAALLVTALWGGGETTPAVAVAVVAWAPLAAHTSALLRQERATLHLAATRALGAGRWYLLRRAILPAVVPPVVRHAVLRLPGIALGLASLGFLGLGAQPPSPEWGLLLAENQPYVERAPWAVLAPATVLALLGALAVTATGAADRRVGKDR
ncbi:ABC transporter permease subunit [Streptomyces sp. DSM 15324]|uniref:ABC transporter permease subunit n=1 Tax=Streptomyces sp. DSM 15324 TaxID=1739111 RepID=UPI00074681CD|nr:ABC transporter permease subunit [Streptomyces sp. DSM 15324]KUO13040.1 ABC transporter permease [Streptomyces sp. DSM 15324]